MNRESNKINELEIVESDINFEKIYSKPYFPKELEEDLKRANLLLVPYEGFKSVEGPVFPEETMKFYKFIKGNEKDELVSEICISDTDFVELELHYDLITLTNMLVDSAVFPIAVGLITNYLDRKLQGRKTEAKVKVNITVVEGDKSKSISYEGDVDKFEETIIAANLFNDNNVEGD